MKVLHAAKFYLPVRGGMETVVRDLAEGTAADWDVSVVAAHDGRGTVVEERQGVRVVRASCWGASHSVPICPSLPFHLWRPGRLRRAARTEPDRWIGALSSDAVAAAGRLASQRPSSSVVGPADLRQAAGRALSTGRLRDRVEPEPRRGITAGAAGAACGDRAVRRSARPLQAARSRDPGGGRSDSPANTRAAPALCRQACLLQGPPRPHRGPPACRGTLMVAGHGPLEAELRRQVAEKGLAERVVFLAGSPTRSCPRTIRPPISSSCRRLPRPRPSASSNSRRWPQGERWSALTCHRRTVGEPGRCQWTRGAAWRCRRARSRAQPVDG